MASETNNIKTSKKDILTNRLFLKSLALVLIMGFGAQFVGFNAVTFYLQTVLESTQTSVRPEVASVTIGCIQLFASFCTTMVTDRFGRKPILTVTCVGMGMGMVSFFCYFFLNFEDLARVFTCFGWSFTRYPVRGNVSLFWTPEALFYVPYKI